MTAEDESDERRRRHCQRYHEAVLDLMTDDDVVEGAFDAALRSVTETAAEIVGATRVSVWLFDDGGDRLRCVDRYDDRTDDHTGGTELVSADYPAYFEALRTHRSISAGDARTDPRTRELTADYLEPTGVESLLDATLRSEGDVIGVVCHEQVGRTREWTETEIQFAGDVADVVHRALRNHRSAEQRRELEFRRSLLEAQQEAMPDGVLVVGDGGELHTWNTRFRDLWNLSADGLEPPRGDAVLDRIRDRVTDPAAFIRRVEHLTENPAETSHDELALDDGRVFELYSTPVRSDAGTQYGRLWLVRDITERRERQDELELKNRTIDEAPIGITLSDATRPDNPLVYANDQFERLTGYAREEILGRNCRFLQGERTATEPVDDLRAAIDAERSNTVELRNYRKDGSEFWNRVTVAPVADENGDVTNYVGFQQDVTERKEATRQLRVLHRVLRHNLANQMSIIRGTAEQLAERSGGDTEAAAETIVEEADQLLGLTDKHRSIVRLLSERPTPEPIALEPLCRRPCRSVRMDYPHADVTLAGDPNATVVGIPTLETAIHELLVNGVVHGDRASPSVELRVERRPETVHLRIVDDGPGLPEEERRIITGDGTVEPLYHGLGMGLWLVHWIVSLSRGTIDIEETGPDGTTIRIELPRADE
ncbi:multi-sensor signal transduction histidine kinase [Haloterrigena turkmenica DSM 5511]|uniref:Multi-sensor signal transduction histidine kinase n=1 Tax=Haloterrigena turkmenica (strain ATCC 51198 / DSM 5511 / JCM 9101 / NCIMB 13204 / VKM B-1734 / 4k) TaxID=543526 RepID=D2RZP8_HALTV|nr:PAS domain-containing protein [Haloterrigena turkmenica]ADB62087.1 multi-sensor signal transduction histidine kinase [Haloterrigena turkmenica DSM 5511]